MLGTCSVLFIDRLIEHMTRNQIYPQRKWRPIGANYVVDGGAPHPTPPFVADKVMMITGDFL